jgi:inner membrane protein
LDPIAHTFTGATLAAAGLRRKTPLATAVLLIGANAPDIDVIAYFGDSFQALAFRRGITHGVLALALWPFLIAALVLAWDRCVRLKAVPGAAPARAGPVLGLAAIAVLTHPALDWLNNYGMRWLMPFDGTWSYGDAVFIIDPWIWLALGSVPFLVRSRRTGSLLAWSAFWLLASLLVLTASTVPVASRVLWLACIAALFAARVFRPALASRGVPYERSARALLGVAIAYVGVMAVVDFAEREAVRAELAARGIGPVGRVMVAPVAANPFAGAVVAETPTAYYIGDWRWLGRPKLTLSPEPLVREPADPVVDAAAATVEAERFLTWARFPYALTETDGEEHIVRFLDARYYTVGRLQGPTVRLDRNLRPLPSR